MAPAIGGTGERAADRAIPRRPRSMRAGRSATAVAIAVSACLHGAFAAGIFLWPSAPVPLPAGPPVVVELVAAPAGPQPGEAAVTASAAGRPADTVADAAVPLSIQGGAPEHDGTPERPPTPIEAAELAEPPAPEPLPAPVFPRPVRRPELPEDPAVVSQTLRPPPVQASADPPVDESPTTGQGAAGADGSAAEVVSHADGDDGASLDDAVAGAPTAGPRFVLGSAGNPLPRYPTAARRRGLEGRVVLHVLVAEDGRVRTVDVRTSSRHPLLDEAAVTALGRWRFEPARKAGRPVAAWVEVPIAFKLSD